MNAFWVLILYALSFTHAISARTSPSVDLPPRALYDQLIVRKVSVEDLVTSGDALAPEKMVQVLRIAMSKSSLADQELVHQIVRYPRFVDWNAVGYPLVAGSMLNMHDFNELLKKILKLKWIPSLGSFPSSIENGRTIINFIIKHEYDFIQKESREVAEIISTCMEWASYHGLSIIVRDIFHRPRLAARLNQQTLRASLITAAHLGHEKVVQQYLAYNMYSHRITSVALGEALFVASKAHKSAVEDLFLRGHIHEGNRLDESYLDPSFREAFQAETEDSALVFLHHPYIIAIISDNYLNFAFRTASAKGMKRCLRLMLSQDEMLDRISGEFLGRVFYVAARQSDYDTLNYFTESALYKIPNHLLGKAFETAVAHDAEDVVVRLLSDSILASRISQDQLFDGLYIASFKGMTHVVVQFTHQHVISRISGDQWGTALAIASQNSNVGLVNYLVNHEIIKTLIPAESILQAQKRVDGSEVAQARVRKILGESLRRLDFKEWIESSAGHLPAGKLLLP